MRQTKRTALYLLLMAAGSLPLLRGQDAQEPDTRQQDTQQQEVQRGVSHSLAVDTGVVSKYIFRGQRATNDWSLQPSITLGVGEFSFNFWGNLDMAAVNEGDSLLVPENPAALPGQSGLKGKFSEVNYVFSYAHSFEAVGIEAGTIVYGFPERSVSLPSTTEVYLGVSLDTLPLTPSATLYVDVDETGAAGDTGMYFLLGAEHKFGFGHSRFPGLGISTSLGLANGGFANYFYGAQESGLHDYSLTFTLPVNLGEKWSASPFVTYSALLGNFRDHQYLDPRRVLRGTAGAPNSAADTVWGGLTLSMEF